MRISLLKSVAKRQKEHDPNSVCSVSSFTARPMLRVGGKDQSTRFLNFIDAMAGFRHLLTQEDRDKAASLCQNLRGHLRSRFIVLSDDKVPPPPPNRKRPRSDQLPDTGSDVQDLSNGKRFMPGTGANAQPLGVPPFSSGFDGQAQSQARPGVSNQPHGYHTVSTAFDVHAQAQNLIGVAQAPVQAHSLPPVHQAISLTQQVPSLSSPNSFPPLVSTTRLNEAAGSLEDGFQTVSGRGGRRQSQHVIPGVQKIKQKQNGRGASRFDGARGLTEELAGHDTELQGDLSGGSPTMFVDAADEL